MIPKKIAAGYFPTKQCKVVSTQDMAGIVNGKLMEIASIRDGWSKFLDNSQIYLTTLLPKKKKGFHLHHKKENQVTCIKGRINLGVWDGKNIHEFVLDADSPTTVRVPKGNALCFYNSGNKVAYILNLCSPPYNPDDPEQEDIDLEWTPKE